MGMLIKGEWVSDDVAKTRSDGEFIRQDMSFRGSVSPDPGAQYPAARGRYHLYVSYACPWAHRTLIVRKLKRLEDAIDVSVVDHFMGEDGWTFTVRDGSTPDRVNGFDYLRDVYVLGKPDFTGRVTVPVLWDTETDTIVNNESSEIIRIFNTAFDELGNGVGAPEIDFYPEDLREEIDQLNADIYDNINNGVYKTGFASSQNAYERNFDNLFAALDRVEKRLADNRYLMGDRITEADWRLFTTLIRFDPVYVTHFKCNLRRIDDYPNLSNYTRDLLQTPGVAETVNMHHIKMHYFGSHGSLNPRGIVAKGPEIDYTAPHDRDRLRPADPRLS